MKSIVISIHGCVGGSRNCISLYSSCRDALFVWHSTHLAMYSVTSCFMFRNVYLRWISSIVLLIPGCPRSIPSWCSLIVSCIRFSWTVIFVSIVEGPSSAGLVRKVALISLLLALRDPSAFCFKMLCLTSSFVIRSSLRLRASARPLSFPGVYRMSNLY